MKRAYPSRIATAALSGILSAAFLMSSSCGKHDNPRKAAERQVPDAEIERPSSTDFSAWFPFTGPDRLDKYAEDGPGTGSAIVDMLAMDSTLLVLDSGGRVFAKSDESGRWISMGGNSPEVPVAAMAADETYIYILDQQGLMSAFHTGIVSGKRGLGEPAWSSHPEMDPDWIQVVPGGIVCASADGRLAVLSASDGSVRAFRDLGLPITGGPVAAGSVLVVARSSGLAALSIPNLEFLWSEDRAPSYPPALRTVRTFLAFQNPEGAWQILDARTGMELYGIPSVRGSAAGSDGERWYIAEPDGGIGAFRITDGVPVWTAGAVSEGSSRGRAAALSPPRIAVQSGRIFVARRLELESWNSETGELIERTEAPPSVDGVILSPGRLHCRMRGGTIRTYGSDSSPSVYPDPESAVRPDPVVSEAIRGRLEKYAEPESALRLAWRIYIPGAAPSPDFRFTLLQYEVREAGKRIFSQRMAGRDPLFIGVFDASGSERYTNVGELGADSSFEFWMEPGTWYIAVGTLRGKELQDPVFLEIR